jgi:guanylate kinase
MTLKVSESVMQSTQYQHQKQQGQIFVISGPSGVGKGTLCNQLLADDPSLMLSISATTRKPRSGELDGINYHFYAVEKFEAMIAHDAQESDPQQHQLLEWAQYNGNYYGTPRKAVDDACQSGHHVLLEIETQGAFQIKEKIPNACLIFIAPPSLEALVERLKGRGTESETEINNRLDIARHELTLTSQFDITLVNNQLETCLSELKKAIKHF